MVLLDHFVDDSVNLVTLLDELFLGLLSQRLFLLKLFGNMNFCLLHLLEDLSVLLFLSGGVVLPTPGSDAGHSLISDFEQRGKLSLVFLAAYILAWVPANAWSEGTWFTSDVWLNLGLVVLLTVTYFSPSRRLQGTATGLFLAAQGYGLLFVWATPTDLG